MSNEKEPSKIKLLNSKIELSNYKDKRPLFTKLEVSSLYKFKILRFLCLKNHKNKK